jgi:hypothetical protein
VHRQEYTDTLLRYTQSNATPDYWMIYRNIYIEYINYLICYTQPGESLIVFNYKFLLTCKYCFFIIQYLAVGSNLQTSLTNKIQFYIYLPYHSALWMLPDVA